MLGMNDLISNLERQLTFLMSDSNNTQSSTFRNRSGTSRTFSSGTNIRSASSRDLLQVISSYQSNIEQYQQTMDLLIRLLSRTLNYERTLRNTSNSPNLFTNSHIFAFYQDLAGLSPVEERVLSQAEIRQETTAVVYDASSAQHHVCPISLEDFVQGESITKICGCGHIFKTEYLMIWLEHKNYCPVCRYNLLDHSYNDVGEPDTPNPVMTEEYEVIPPSTNTSTNDEQLERHITFEIPLLYDTSSNRLLNPENGERTTTRTMQNYIMRELMRGMGGNYGRR